MYSNKGNVNILTALLVKHGVRHAVVCPGSRNAAIVHNLNECPHITCYPVTDERSAAFYALGMTDALNEPVVVCVTSGTALLNVTPAVAEAYYRHRPLIVISADRPAAWIGQIDGQTLPQPDALGRFVTKAVTLPEIPSTDDNDAEVSHWHCNRLVNEALLEAYSGECSPVHINVPITEPLFDFSVEQLPDERIIRRYHPSVEAYCFPSDFLDDLKHAQRPLVVVGQMPKGTLSDDAIQSLLKNIAVLSEPLSPINGVTHFDEVLASGVAIDLPDFILYVGDTLVSKRLKAFLRKAKDAKVWRANATGTVEDTFQNLQGVLVGNSETVLQSLSQEMDTISLTGSSYHHQWLTASDEVAKHVSASIPSFSQMLAVKCFEERLSQSSESTFVHYANSMAVRLAVLYARHYVYCNRGVNGIEGSLSTAAGFSSVVRDQVFCVIGDLSFFYDQNALWNVNLKGNLRILLLNNGGGAIFRTLRGLEQSAAQWPLVAAAHHTTAEGICQQCDIYYQRATNEVELQQGLDLLFNTTYTRPMVLEVMTDAEEDKQNLIHGGRAHREG